MASAFLMSYESALQVLNDEFAVQFEKWLSSLSPDPYDFICRGLRTMRHLEAHVRAGHIEASHLRAHSRFASGTDGGETIAWQWAPVSIEEFSRLDRPRITEAELPEWNRVLEKRTDVGANGRRTKADRRDSRCRRALASPLLS
jgi:hypothetical protein